MAQTHFGYQTVDEDEKANHVRGVFDSDAGAGLRAMEERGEGRHHQVLLVRDPP